MKEVSFTIHTTPTPQARHRESYVRDKQGNPVIDKNNRPVAIRYDPCKDKKNWYKAQVLQHFPERITGPIEMFVTFYMPIPKSTSKKRQALMDEGVIKHQKKPDRDNLDKLLTDAMEDIAYHNDSQIWHSDVYKVYSHNPRTEVTIKWDPDYEY